MMSKNLLKLMPKSLLRLKKIQLQQIQQSQSRIQLQQIKLNRSRIQLQQIQQIQLNLIMESKS